MTIKIEFIDGDKTVTLQISEAEIVQAKDPTTLIQVKVKNALYMLRWGAQNSYV